MPTKSQEITTLTRGNDVTLKFTIATTVNIAAAKFWAKRKTTDGDGDAAVAKVVTSTLTSDGQITDTTAPSVTIQIILSKNDTAAFVADLDYGWDLEVFDGSNKSTTPIGGIMRLAERQRTATG